MQSALADIDGLEDLKVEVGSVTYSGQVKPEEVITVIESKTRFTAELE